MKRECCSYCGTGRFGLVRYRISWMKVFCSKECKRLGEKRAQDEVRQRKAFLHYLAQD